MKLLTLNTHSLVEAEYPQKLRAFVETIAEELPDIIALQEVSQTRDAEVLPENLQKGYVPCIPDAFLRADNHVYNAVRMLSERGVQYSFTWLPIKLGYGKYDEGIALMSRSPILETDTLTVSRTQDDSNWKTRRIAGIRTAAAPTEWFWSVHYGWWDDAEEPFAAQWERTLFHLRGKENVWLLGDFNNPAQVRQEGYDLMVQSGWHDSYHLARCKDDGITVGASIDGWHGKFPEGTGLRIDRIHCSKRAQVRSSRVMFNGRSTPVVSDHYGVMIEYERNGI